MKHMAYQYQTWRPAPVSDVQAVCNTKIIHPERIDLIMLEQVRADWAAAFEKKPLAGPQKAAGPPQVTVPVKFTHFVDPATGYGFVSATRRSKLIKALNNAFKSSRIRFKNAKVEVVEDDRFCFDLENDVTEQTAKQKYHADPDRFLNLYTAALSPSTWGWATFPTDYMFPANNPAKWMDGVVVAHTVLPGGPDPKYAVGKRVVHEVGHWLGLFHTFHLGCAGNGDDIPDTPAHFPENYGNPADGAPNGACNAGELAPIHNFMNYTDDVCMTHFTTEQTEKIRKVMQLFRPGL